MAGGGGGGGGRGYASSAIRSGRGTTPGVLASVTPAFWPCLTVANARLVWYRPIGDAYWTG